MIYIIFFIYIYNLYFHIIFLWINNNLFNIIYHKKSISNSSRLGILCPKSSKLISLRELPDIKFWISSAYLMLTTQFFNP